MHTPEVHRVALGEPQVKLMIANGSERGDFMPLGQLTQLLGGVHAGVNLMAEYYPGRQVYTSQLGLPYRTLFGPDVPHYRNWYKDQTDKTKMLDPKQGTDGYYFFDPTNPKNDVVLQMENGRRYGYDPRLTLTADIETPLVDLGRIAEFLKDFGPVDLRLNHEANGNTWFRFAQRVGELTDEGEKRKLYYEIAQFFIRAHETITRTAPNVRLVACYNGPAEAVNSGILKPGEYPNLTAEELGLMYRLEGIGISIDQYGSLHYGWPGHTIEHPPIFGRITHDQHRSFGLEPDVLFEKIILPFQDYMETLRGERVRLDLGEMNYDQDIHGPKIAADLIRDCYERIRNNAQAIGSVVFYDAADMGGLGLFHQNPYDYGNLTDLTESEVTGEYRKIMQWPEFQHPTRMLAGTISPDTQSLELVWQSSSAAVGLEFKVDPSVNAVDLRKKYWRRIVFANGKGGKIYEHTDKRVLTIPEGTESVQIFALPPDGRDNCSDGYRASVPLPEVATAA